MLEPSADEIRDWGNSVTQFMIEYLGGLREHPGYPHTSLREILNRACSFSFETGFCGYFRSSLCWHVCSPRPNAGSCGFRRSALFPAVRIGFVCLRCRRFLIAFLRAWLSFDERVIWYDNQLLA